MESYSQYRQDILLNERIFKNKKNGVFLDIGAYDGITLSNTYFFEKYLNWTGVCIEPLPLVFNQLKNNRKCQCIHGFACNNNDPSTRFIEIKDGPEMLSCAESLYNAHTQGRIKAECDNSGHLHCKIDTITVPNVNINNLIKDLSYIDLCNIDTEGYVKPILETLDCDKIQCFCIENDQHDGSLIELMYDKGYTFMDCVGIDDIYLKT